MPTNIFIDTSSYLSFYAVSNDDLEQLEKFVGLIADGQIKILITAQVVREWLRNRDNKLAEAIGSFEKFSLKMPSIPRFMLEYDELSELRKTMAAAEKAKSAVVTRAKLEASTATTNADRLIQRIFAVAGIERDDAEVFALAERRMAVGDLPGKPGSLGDRLNWQHLLASEITDGDLHIISKDGDYFSPLDDNTPKYALYREWVEKKNGKLFVHREIKPFLTAKFPQFRFRPESQVKPEEKAPERSNVSRFEGAKKLGIALKDAAILEFEKADNSVELSRTVRGLEKLLPYFSETDLLRICKYAGDSDVVHDYDGEDNINAFFESVIPKIHHLLGRKEIEALEETFQIEIHPEEFEIKEDYLAPDYGQMDLDLLDEIVDSALASEPLAEEPYEPFLPYSAKDEVPFE